MSVPSVEFVTVTTNELARVKSYNRNNHSGFMQVLNAFTDINFNRKALSIENKITTIRRGLFAHVAPMQLRPGEWARNIVLYHPNDMDEDILDLFRAGRKLKSEIDQFWPDLGRGRIKKPADLEYALRSSNKYRHIFFHWTDIVKNGKTIEPGAPVEFWLMEDQEKGPQAVCAILL